MNYKHVDNGNGQTAITCNEWIADCFIPQGHPNHDIIVSRIMDSLNTLQICDRLPSEILHQRDEALELLNRAINALNRSTRSDEHRGLNNEHSQLINKIENGKQK